jgi:hypothetical protein
MKRLFSTGTICLMAVCALALPGFVKVFAEVYKPKPMSDLGKGKCMVCHTSKMGGSLNAYGVDLKKALGSSKTLTAAVLKKVEALDSDKDGMKNGEEIKAGRLPGAKG